eukprot:g26979.t2
MAILDQEHQQRIPVKVTAFRQFAANLMAQLTEQLCLEFEREVSAMTEDKLTRFTPSLSHGDSGCLYVVWL